MQSVLKVHCRLAYASITALAAGLLVVLIAGLVPVFFVEKQAQAAVVGIDFLVNKNGSWPSTANSGSTVTLNVSVVNGGTVGVSGSILVTLYVNGASRQNQTIVGLASNASKNLSFTYTASCGSNSVEVYADDDNAYDEAIESNNTTSGTVTVNVLCPPSSFSGSAVSGSSSKINWSWSSVSGATSYTIYTTSGTPIQSGLTGTSWIETGLTKSTSYSRQIATCNSNGCGPRSSTASATTNAMSTPTIQTPVYNYGSNGKIANSGQINWYWSWPDSMTGMKFEVQVRKNGVYDPINGYGYSSGQLDVGATEGTQANCSGSTCNWKDVRARVCNEYWDAHVQAIDGSNNSVWSDWSELVEELKNPGTPGNPTFSGTSQTGTTVSWTSGSGATSYEVRRCQGSTCTTPSTVATDNASPYNDSGLSCGTTYRYWIRAINACGNADSSSGTTITTSACPLPDLTVQKYGTWPTSVCANNQVTFPYQVRNTGNTSAGYMQNRLYVDNNYVSPEEFYSSSIPAGGDTGAPGSSCTSNDNALCWTPSSAGTYDVQVKTDSGDDTNLNCNGAPGSGQDVPNESSESNNCLRDSNGNTQAHTLTVTATPGSPAGLGETSTGQTSITWGWNAVSGASSYDIYVDGAFQTNQTGTSYQKTSLSCGTSHTISVTPKNSCGSGSAATDSATTSACPLPDLVIDDVWTTQSTICSAQSVTLNATVRNAGSGSAGGSETSLQLGSASCGIPNTPSLGGGASTNVSCNTTASGSGSQTLQATADAAADVAESNETNNTRSETGYTVNSSPGTPSGLGETSTSQTSITWGWNAVSGATSYDVYVDGTFRVNQTGTSYPASGFSCNTSHTITVTAKNSCGSGGSASDFASTSACPLSDLVIQDAPAISGNLCAGQSQQLSSTVFNQGNASTGASVTVAYEFAGSNRCSGSGSALTTGDTVSNYSCSYTPASAGSQTIYAIADKPSVITESNEGNNQSPNFTVNFLSSPGTPGMPTFSSVGNTSVTVNWSDVSGESNYRVYRNTTNSKPASSSSGDLAANTTSWVNNTGLSSCTTYYYWVEAVNSCGVNTGPSGSVTTTGCNTGPNTPSSLSQEFNGSSRTEGSWVNDATPAMLFTISDPNAGDTVGYQIQIDDASAFSSPAVDFTWAGSTTNPNSVRYDVPSNLTDGTYYWHARAKDAANLYSSWIEFATAGTADFRLDTAAPTSGSCSYSPSGPTNGSVTASVTFSDSLSGISGSATQSCTRSTNGDCTVSVNDNAGNSASRTCSITNIDTTPPPAPTCAPGSQSFSSSITVSCTDSESGVTIRYTTNGTDPTTSSPTYSGSLTFTSTTTLKVRAWDAAGNQSGVNQYDYTQGNIPNTTISATPSDPTNDSTPTFSFTGTNSPTSYECRLDSGAWFSCASSYTFSSVSQGSHTFEVRASNGFGTDPSPASFTWLTDLTNPTCGSSSYSPSGWTNGSVTVTVTCSDTGGSGCQQSTYSTTMSTNGAPSFTVRDNAGNQITFSCGANVTNIDKTYPSLDSLSVSESTNPGNSVSYPSSLTITVGDPTIAWTASDTGGSALQQTEVWRASGSCSSPTGWTQVNTNTTSPGSGSWPNTGLSNGTYCFGMHVKDTAQNCLTEDAKDCTTSSVISGRTVRGPITVAISRSTPDFSVSFSAPTSMSVTQGTSATFNIAVTPSGGFTSSVGSWTVANCPSGASCSVSPASCASANYASCGTLTITTGSVTPGTYSNITVTGTGGSLTRTSTNSVSVTVNSNDTTAPTVAFSPASRSWANTDASVAATASDSSGVSYTRHCWTTSASCDPGTTAANTFTNGSAVTQSSNGSWNLCVRARDNSSNQNWNAIPTSTNGLCSGTYQVDKAYPSIDSLSVSESTNGANSATYPASLTITSASGYPTIDWTASDTGGSSLQQAEVWRATGNCSAPSGWTQVMVDSSTPAAGPYTDSTVGNGTYCYGIHAKDTAQNCLTEDAKDCITSAVVSGRTVRGPITVTINRSTPDFTINLTPSSRSVIQGNSTTYTVAITPSGGFSSTVSTWSVVACPASATCTLSFSTCASAAYGNCGTLTVGTTGVTPGSYTTLHVRATSPSTKDSNNVTLTVTSGVNQPPNKPILIPPQ